MNSDVLRQSYFDILWRSAKPAKNVFFFVFFPSLQIKLCFRGNFFEIIVSQYLEKSKTSRNVIFSWRPDVCVCVRVCPILNVANSDHS